MNEMDCGVDDCLVSSVNAVPTHLVRPGVSSVKQDRALTLLLNCFVRRRARLSSHSQQACT